MSKKPADVADQLAYTVKCRHFNGIMNDVCLAGIRYDSFPQTGVPYQRLPCITTRSVNNCVSVSRYTKAESKAMAAEDTKQVNQMLAEMAAGLCVVCKKAVEGVKQVGRCVYATNCGHRIGQGRAKQMTQEQVDKAKAYNRRKR